MKNIKIVSSKRILKGRLLEVFETHLVLSSGGKRVHHIATRPPIVSVFPITEGYDIFLVSQYRYLLDKTTLEAMAGFIEPNESPLQAAKRELKEETGLVAKKWEKFVTAELAGSVFKGQAHLFFAKDLKEGEALPEESENIQLVRMSLDEAVKRVLRGEINHAASMIGILFLDRLKRNNKL